MHTLEVKFRGRANDAIGIAYTMVQQINLENVKLDQLPHDCVFALGRAGFQVSHITEITLLRFSPEMDKIVRCQLFSFSKK
jgi:hypothetical protein